MSPRTPVVARLGISRYAPVRTLQWNKKDALSNAIGALDDRGHRLLHPHHARASKSESICILLRYPQAVLADDASTELNLLVKSKLVVLELARLEQTADLHGALTLLVFGLLRRLLAVLGVELRVLAAKLLQ